MSICNRRRVNEQWHCHVCKLQYDVDEDPPACLDEHAKHRIAMEDLWNNSEEVESVGNDE